MACIHSALSYRAPSSFDKVYKTECTSCFKNIDGAAGIDVCLTCFNGGCAGLESHSADHSHKHSHPMALNIKRKKIMRSPRPEKMARLVVENQDAQEFSYEYRLHCIVCNLNTDLAKSEVLCYQCRQEQPRKPS